MDNAGEFVVEPAQESDAAGIARCFREVYGDHYFHPEVFSPADYWKKVMIGAIAPVVARNGRREVIGHLALERLSGCNIAERGEAIVLPSYRGLHLLEAMTEKLFTVAQQIKLIGVFAQPLTMHTFSQQNDARAKMYACSLMLGAGPENLRPKDLPAPTSGQRQSFVTTFRFLESPKPRVISVFGPYRDVILQIYDRLGVDVSIEIEGVPQISISMFTVESDEFGNAAMLFSKIGLDVTLRLNEQFDALMKSKISTVQLSACINDPGLSSLIGAAWRLNFFFCGIGPAFHNGIDTLILQFLREPLEMNKLQLFSDHTKFLASFIQRDRELSCSRF